MDRHAWAEAYEHLRDGADDDLDALEMRADAAWWLARIDECIDVREDVFRRCEASGDRQRETRTALTLYDAYCFKGRRAVATGWMARARRAAEGLTDCAETGVLLVREAEVAHSEGDLEGAAAFAQRALDLGRRLGHTDLEAESLQCLGRILIVGGEPEKGLALYDEAMLPASEGRLGPFVAGKIYCSLISACEELWDVRRAAEWTAVGARWAESHPFSAFPGLCRVHRAEVLQVQGAWASAEAEARRASAELDGVNHYSTALCFKEIGEIRRRLGDFAGAEAAFRQAADLGLVPQPGLALLRLAQGDTRSARRLIAESLGEETNPLARAKLLRAGVSIAVAAEDLEQARTAADDLDALALRFASSGLTAAACAARGQVLLAEGDATKAVGRLRHAARLWQELDAPYEAASTRVLLALAEREVGDEAEACACLTAALRTFTDLGALHDVEQTQRLLTRDLCLPAQLTAREVEVLRLVASGATNRSIAETLVLSERTVDRHMSNILRKLGVSSRTAATAFAFENGLAPVRG